MADTDNPITENDTTEEVEPNGDNFDWKSASRKWEKLAKQNKAAAEELAALKASQLTETEKLTKRAEDAEALVRQYEQRQQHDADALEVSEKTGVPLQLLMYCSDRDSMEKFAEQYGDATHVKSAPNVPGSRLVGGSSNPKHKSSTRDIFGEFIAENF